MGKRWTTQIKKKQKNAYSANGAGTSGYSQEKKKITFPIHISKKSLWMVHRHECTCENYKNSSKK